jgi:hypothetical protein
MEDQMHIMTARVVRAAEEERHTREREHAAEGGATLAAAAALAAATALAAAEERIAALEGAATRLRAEVARATTDSADALEVKSETTLRALHPQP